MLSNMRKLLSVAGGGRGFLLVLVLRSPVSAAMTCANAVFLQQAFDAIAQKNGGQLTAACLIFGFANLCIFLYNGTAWGVFVAPILAKMEGKLRAKLFCKISSLSCERVDAVPESEWLTRLNTDVHMPFSEAFPHTAIAIANIGASAFMLWKSNPAVFGWVTLFVTPHIAVSQILIARAMPGLQQKSLEATAKNTGELTALITCADIAALYDGTDFLMKRFEQSSLSLYRANMRIRARNALSDGMMPLFGLGGYLTLLIVSGRWIAGGHFTFGGLTAAFQYRGGILMGSLMLIQCLISMQAGMASVRRLNETMAEKSEVRPYG